MDLVHINYLLFGSLHGLAGICFFGGILAALAYRLAKPEVNRTIPFSGVISLMLFRIAIGGAVFIGSLFLGFLSAIPYGGGNKTLFAITRITLTLAPFWAGFAVAKMGRISAKVEEKENDSDSRPIGFGRIIVSTALACVSIGVVFRATFFPLPEDPDQEARIQRRNQAIAQCRTEIQNIADEYIIDSLLIDINFFDESDLIELLGDKGIRFVEIRTGIVKPYPSEGEKDRWGISGHAHGERHIFDMDKNTNYVKYDLSVKGDSRCINRTYWLGIEDPKRPFAPDTCIRETPVQQSTASHAIKVLPSEMGEGFIRWSLLEQSSGKILAALTSDIQSFSSRVRTPKGFVDCRNLYHSLTSALNGSVENRRPSLSLIKRVIQSEHIDLSSEDMSWPAIYVDEVALPQNPHDTEKGDMPRWAKSWESAYRKAEATGFGTDSEVLINYEAGELLSLNHVMFAPINQFGSPSHKVIASKYGFAVIFWHSDRKTLGLVRYGLDGKIKWHGLILVNRDNDAIPSVETETNSLLWWQLNDINWDEDEIQIYFGKGTVKEIKSHWILRVPNSMIGMKEN